MKKSDLRQQKREEAEARQAARNKRSPKEQLALLDARGVKATKERRRLMGAL